MGTRRGFLNHRLSSPVPMTGTTPVSSTSLSSSKALRHPRAGEGPQATAEPLLQSCSDPQLLLHPPRAAGHPTSQQSSRWRSSTSAPELLSRGSSRGALTSLQAPLSPFHADPRAGHHGLQAEEKGHGDTVCCLERHDCTHPRPAPSHLLGGSALLGTRSSPEKVKLHRSVPQNPSPTNPTQKIPKPRDEDNSAWSHRVQPWWLCVGRSGLLFKKHRQWKSKDLENSTARLVWFSATLLGMFQFKWPWISWARNRFGAAIWELCRITSGDFLFPHSDKTSSEVQKH